MKKSVLLMAGVLAVALAGSAQAATTMFAVQNAGGTQDMAAISDAGDIALAGKIASGLQNIPGSVPLAAGDGALRIGTIGNGATAAAGTFQHIATPLTPGGSAFAAGAAPNFSMYRNNRNDSGVFSFPAAAQTLGAVQFGTVDVTLDPTTPAYKKNLAIFAVRAETSWPSITNTPVYFSWETTSFNGTANVRSEKMRLSATGNLGIGTTTPKAKLHVVGLVEYADNATAIVAGLTDGAFYRTGDVVKVVHP